MKLPSQEQIDLGNLAAQYFYDLCINQAIGGDLPVTSEILIPPNEKVRVIGDLYLKGDIDYVTAIYLTMTGDANVLS
jgi:hypothetical protein